MINSDIDSIIFNCLPITDKRSLLRTCKSFNKFSHHMPQIEADFQNMINDTNFLDDKYYSGLCYPLYKFTTELLYDDRDIPDKYIIFENRMLHQYSKISFRLAERGNIKLVEKILQWGINSYRGINSTYMMYGAAYAGNIKILRWMIKKDYRCDEGVAAYAAKGNQLETLKWLIKKNIGVSNSAVYYASGEGHVEVLDFLVNEKKCKGISYNAACNGKFEIVKYLHSIDKDSLYGVCDGAVRSGHLDMLKYGYENGQRIVKKGIFCNSVSILTWLIENGHINPSEDISVGIAQAGSLECLQLLYHHKYPILRESVMVGAISGRNIDMIKWLHELKCPVDDNAIGAAITRSYPNQKGSLPILKILVEWKYPIKDDICDVVAFYGNLEILQYLVSIGCRLNHKVISMAAKSGHLHIVIWAREQGCDWNADACYGTLEDYHFNVLRWLRGFDRLGSSETEICPWDDKFGSEAVRCGRNDMLTFARCNGYQFSDDMYRRALETKRMQDELYGRVS